MREGVVEMRRETQKTKRMIHERGVEFLVERRGEDVFRQRRRRRRQSAESDQMRSRSGRVGGQQVGQLDFSRGKRLGCIEIDENRIEGGEERRRKAMDRFKGGRRGVCELKGETIGRRVMGTREKRRFEVGERYGGEGSLKWSGG